MNTVCKLSKLFWQRQKFAFKQQVSCQETLLFVYVTTHPNANKMGIYPLSISAICEDLLMNKQDVKDSLHTLIANELCEYDFDREIIWVLDMAYYHHLKPRQRFHDLPTDKRKRLLKSIKINSA